MHEHNNNQQLELGAQLEHDTRGLLLTPICIHGSQSEKKKEIKETPKGKKESSEYQHVYHPAGGR